MVGYLFSSLRKRNQFLQIQKETSTIICSLSSERVIADIQHPKVPLDVGQAMSRG